MMSTSDRRRRARVQGGWASSSAGPRSDAHRDPAPLAPAWTDKTVDSPEHKPRCYVYEEPEQVVI